ncbi:hypothetical protein CF70_013000 [Cupriavidus sp. SK-3]|uniref:hypothetical protein n=1 Tax=Cupriavidus sp. SK-3 TaxID=1470558 RepID=UPI0004509FD7|nr:hypothetical protein [Cupriavidus sp. SK-3]KDP85610.1 hypothetical protein CF70_013000 [Cupriavidus sp. SK-3]
MGIIESVQSYDLNIPAGGAQNIDVAGDRVHFLSAGDPAAQIEIRPNYAQGNISLKPGQGFRFSEQVTRWVVFNKSNLPLYGTLMIGSGDFFDQRITGDVNVIDNAKARTLANTSFITAIGAGGTAGTLAHCQLWNPAGRNVSLIVEGLEVSAGAATAVNIWLTNGALGTLQSNPVSKLAGGAASGAEGRVYNGAAASGSQLFGTSLQANVPYQRRFVEPIVLPPGWGMFAMNNTVNQSLNYSVEYFEA